MPQQLELHDIQAAIFKFAQARDWEQFHNPKNLAMALGVVVAELQELLMWVEGKRSLERVQEKQEAIENEVGDILIYLLRFCDITGIDPIQAAERKMKLNAENILLISQKGTQRSILNCKRGIGFQVARCPSSFETLRYQQSPQGDARLPQVDSRF